MALLRKWAPYLVFYLLWIILFIKFGAVCVSVVYVCMVYEQMWARMLEKDIGCPALSHCALFPWSFSLNLELEWHLASPSLHSSFGITGTCWTHAAFYMNARLAFRSSCSHKKHWDISLVHIILRFHVFYFEAFM